MTGGGSFIMSDNHPRPPRAPVALIVAGLALVAGSTVIARGGASSPALPAPLAPAAMDEGRASPVLPSGHPTAELAAAVAADPSAPAGSSLALPTPGQLLPGDPPDAPLVSGEFVNFESPVHRPLALNSSGTRLFVTNTPNNRLEVLDTTGPRLRKVRDIPVGLDPVAVALQPGTAEQVAWVVNHLSDNVTIVNVATGQVLAAIEVGDEPVNLLFNSAGTLAFVILQGSPLVPDLDGGAPDLLVQEGALVAMGTTPPYPVLRSRYLDCNTPRAAVYDPASQRVIVAALHSGNNTTVVGQPVLANFAAPLGACCLSNGSCVDANAFDCFDLGGMWQGGGTNCGQAGVCSGPFVPPSSPPPDPCGCRCSCAAFPDLLGMQLFTNTFPPTPAATFAAGALAPWPDLWTANPTGPAGPLVMRIVSDPGTAVGAWNDILALLDNGAGQPDPQRVADFAAQFGLLNAQQVLQETMDDAKDTVDHDLRIVDVSNPAGPAGLAVLPAVSLADIGTTLTGLALNPASGDLFVSNLDARNLVRLGANLKGHLVDHEVVVVRGWQQAGPTVTHANLHAGVPGFNDVALPNPAAQAASLANPMDLAFRPDGARAYVAAFGVGRVGVLDGSTAAVLGRVDVGRGPRGLALDAAAHRLYVFNRTDLSISVVDVSSDAAPAVTQTHALFNPEPAAIRNGRDFLFSTRFSANYASACATCHVDGHLDHLGWDLGNPAAESLLHTPFLAIGGNPCPPQGPDINHPLKGAMVTQSLRGLRDHSEFHWRGDKPTFQDFNEAFKNLLGGEELPPADMDAYAAFIETVVYPPNFYRDHRNAFKDPDAIPGRTLFVNSCDACHQLAHDGAMTLPCVPDGDDIGFNLSGIFAQVQEVPQLRQIHKKFNSDRFNGFGLLHDGREERENNDHPIETFLQTFFPGISDPVNSARMIAFLTAWQSNVMPVVGWQVHWTDASPASPQLSDIQAMIAEHALNPSRCDVVLKGMVAGQPAGWWLVQPAPPLFQSDTNTVVGLPALQAIVGAGQPLLATAVPPGSGRRIGIDQDTDGIADGLDPMPQFDNDGDVNLDGRFDSRDLQPFLDALLEPAAAPYAVFHAADADNDDTLSLDDVSAIVDILLPGSA